MGKSTYFNPKTRRFYMVLIDFNKKYTSQHHNLIINGKNKQDTKNNLSLIFSSNECKFTYKICNYQIFPQLFLLIILNNKIHIIKQ